MAVFDHRPQNIDEQPNGCNCVGYTCGCCQHIEVDEIGLNDTGKSYSTAGQSNRLCHILYCYFFQEKKTMLVSWTEHISLVTEVFEMVNIIKIAQDLESSLFVIYKIKKKN